MKKGQMLSQPFTYIFAIIVIGLLLLFGFKYIGKILKTGCEVETINLFRDIQAEVNKLRVLSYGSNFECTFSKTGGTEYRCEFLTPSNIEGICFVDTAKGQVIQENFIDIKELVNSLRGDSTYNLFFSVEEDSACKADPAKIKNIEIEKPLCIDVTKTNKFILENSGNNVQVKSS